MWTRTLSYPATLFTACSKEDSSPLIARLRELIEVDDDQHDWLLYSYSSAVSEDFFSLSMSGVAKLLTNPSFMALKDSHFYLLENPSNHEAADALEEINQDIVMKLIEGVQTVRNKPELIKNLRSIILSLEASMPVSVTSDFDLSALRNSIAALWPNASVNHHVEVVDLINEVVAKTPAKKSIEHRTIELLETKVKYLEARCRAYKRLLTDYPSKSDAPGDE